MITSGLSKINFLYIIICSFPNVQCAIFEHFKTVTIGDTSVVALQSRPALSLIHCVSFCWPSDNCYAVKFDEVTKECQILDHFRLNTLNVTGETTSEIVVDLNIPRKLH